jgi:hypothetical protein
MCIGSTRAKLYAFCHISAVRMRDSRIVAELSWQIRTRPTSNRSKHPNQPKHYSARVRESSTFYFGFAFFLFLSLEGGRAGGERDACMC